MSYRELIYSVDEKVAAITLISKPQCKTAAK
jgi:hypothetical protein